jgi:CheY-like chemotaxis protein
MNAIRIVLIEDNPGDVYLVELALKETGLPCQLIKFASGVEALSVLCPADDAPPPFVPDAILLDLNTPKSLAELLGKRNNDALRPADVG